ncbi:MAG: ribosome maturation factor RimM [Actinomycetota bacterium]|nr:ribosome maturation factor RimM [Actinomycetota bacterium]
MTERTEEVLEVGRVQRAHGIRGELVVNFTTNRPERWATGARLVIAGEWWTVSASRPHQGKILLQLEGVTDRTGAERLGGQMVFATGIEDPEALWVDELIGCVVIDQTGAEHGLVTEVLENPASDLMVLEGGALVPLAFVTGVDASAHLVRVEVPEGLFEEQA